MKKKLICAILSISMLSSLMLGCGGGSDSSAGTDSAEGSQTEEQSGSSEGDVTEITVWSWDAAVEKAIPAFEEANPDIKVNYENVGSASDQYSAIDNALQAGSGFPDVAQFEYFSVPYFAVAEKLADLSEFGADEYADDYVEAAWNGVHFNDTLYALPMDYGQVVMFYNQAVFDQAGITEVPTTWDEYYEAAKKIRTLGDDYYISNEAGDIFLLLSMIWQAGGQPFTYEGDTVKIDFLMKIHRWYWSIGRK